MADTTSANDDAPLPVMHVNKDHDYSRPEPATPKNNIKGRNTNNLDKGIVTSEPDPVVDKNVTSKSSNPDASMKGARRK